MVSNATIAAYHYWDAMDGNAMVCSPLGPIKYRKMCNFNQYILGIVFIFGGSTLIYNATRLGQLASSVGPLKKTPSSKTEEAAERKRAGSKAQMLYFKRFTFVLGFEIMGSGIVHLTSGNGTVYSSSTTTGLVSDFIFTTGVACALYHSLLQLRGAEAFRKILQLPTQAESDGIQRTAVWVTHAFDIAQGAGAFPITFSFWVLLANGTIKRSGLYTATSIFVGCAGIRSIFKNIFDRIRTLSRINAIQKNAGGDGRARNRRSETVRKKIRALIFHMLLIVLSNVFFPLSNVIFGSVHSSTQMLIHHGVTDTLVGFVMIAVCIVTHKQVNASFVREVKLKNMKTRQVLPNVVTGNSIFSGLDTRDSEMSVLGDSLNL